MSESESLSIKEFARLYGISVSTARRQISLNHLAGEMIDGQTRITLAEAERWLAAHGDMVRVTNLSRRDLPSTVLQGRDAMLLLSFSRDYYRLRSDASAARAVARLRAKGFDSEIVPRPGQPHRYRLRDVVELRCGALLERVGPHPDLLLRPSMDWQDK